MELQGCRFSLFSGSFSYFLFYTIIRFLFPHFIARAHFVSFVWHFISFHFARLTK